MTLAVTGVLFGATAHAAWPGLAGPYVGGQVMGAQPSMTIEDSDCWYNCSAYTQRKLGAMLGVQGGFNWISGNLLLGGELEYNFGSIKKEFQYGYYTGPQDNMKLTSKLKNLGSLRLKMGLVSNDTAVAVSVGPATGKFEGEFRDQNNNFNPADDDVASQSGNMSGFVYGIGAEHALTPNLLIGLKYSKYKFTDKTATVHTPAGVNTGSLVKFVNDADTFALGVNWSF
ncbi:MAG: outer membrane protein [Steroidobacteraceae bacterium]